MDGEVDALLVRPVGLSQENAHVTKKRKVEDGHAETAADPAQTIGLGPFGTPVRHARGLAFCVLSKLLTIALAARGRAH